MGRFVDYRGTVHKGRRQPQRGDVTGQPSLEKLAELVKGLSARVQELEAKAGPDWIEVEFAQVPNNAVLVIDHGFNCPVRYYPVFAGAAYSAAGARGPEPDGPISFKVYATDTNSMRLSLIALTTSVNDYKVVIRVEPSQFGVSL